jgi:hypothetical protein
LEHFLLSFTTIFWIVKNVPIYFNFLFFKNYDNKIKNLKKTSQTIETNSLKNTHFTQKYFHFPILDIFKMSENEFPKKVLEISKIFGGTFLLSFLIMVLKIIIAMIIM